MNDIFPDDVTIVSSSIQLPPTQKTRTWRLHRDRQDVLAFTSPSLPRGGVRFGRLGTEAREGEGWGSSRRHKIRRTPLAWMLDWVSPFKTTSWWCSNGSLGVQKRVHPVVRVLISRKAQSTNAIIRCKQNQSQSRFSTPIFK